MGTTKKAAAAILPKIDLTKPKAEDGGKLRVTSAKGVDLEELASDYRDTQDEIDALVQLQKERKQRMIDAVAKKRLAEEKDGRMYKTCTIPTDGDELVYVMWGDVYRKLDTTHVPVLRRAFGRHYEELFSEVAVAKAQGDATVEQIRELLGPSRFDQLSQYIDVKPTIKLRPAFMENRARLRQALDDQTNEAIDSVIEQLQASPTVKVVTPKEA